MSEVTNDEMTVTPRLPEPVFTLQEWLAHHVTPTLNNKPLRYAKWWINKHLVSPGEALQYLDIDGGHRLYVTYCDVRYRVVNVNRVGLLTLCDPENPMDFHLCQMHREDAFTDWSNTLEGPLNESKLVPYISPFPAKDH